MSIRRDLDNGFEFPKKQKLKLRLKDILEENPDEKLYIKKALNIVLTKNYAQWSNSGKMYNSQAERAYYQDGLSPTISASNECGDKSQVALVDKKDKALLIRNANSKGYEEAQIGDFINLQYPSSSTRRGRVGKGIANTLCCTDEQGVVVDAPKVVAGIGEKKSNKGTQWYQQDRIYEDNMAISVTSTFQPYYQTGLMIRKLSAREAWRLMGFDDEDYDKASKVVSISQLYKQAGNSIVVNILVELLKKLLLEKDYDCKKQLPLFDIEL